MKTPLSDIIGALESGVSVNAEERPAITNESGVLKVSAVTGGDFKPEENKVVTSTDELQRLSCSPRAGDILMTRANGSKDLVGCSVFIQKDYPNLFLPDKLWRIVLRDPTHDLSAWLFQVLNSESVREEVINTASGSSGMRNISKSVFLNIRVNRPEYPEQKAIVTVLSTWDRGIRQLTDLIAAKLRFKQGLMQQLLSGHRRFKGFGKPSNDTGQLPEGWKRLKASELFGNFTQKKNDDEDLLSVTQDRGVIPRTMLKGKVVMPESGTGGYKLVEPGNFVISLRSFQGGLEYSQYRGLVSPAYTVLKPCQTINDAFFRHYFKSYDFIQRLAVAVIGIRDGKQISYNDFESVKLPKPPIEEQERIAAVLDISDREINLLGKQLEALKQQKKGLMQKLLTGEVRVKLSKGVV